MTREKAIDLLSMIEFEQAECCLNTWYKGIDDDMEEALKMAIKALKQQSSRDIEEIEEVMGCDADAETKCKMISNILNAKPHYFKEQKPCEDAISRFEVLDLIDSKDPNYEVRHFKEDVECLPSVSTEKTGRWIEEDMFDGDVAYRCSECNELFWIESGTPKDNEYNFCPKCGAKLGVDE